MKTDYTLTPEYEEAVTIAQTVGLAALQKYAHLQGAVSRDDLERMGYLMRAMSNDTSEMTSEQMARMQNFNPLAMASTFQEAIQSHAAGEPLIRTVCKIAARILFVLLLAGIALGVMI